jgi:hypothetical protein
MRPSRVATIVLVGWCLVTPIGCADIRPTTETALDQRTGDDPVASTFENCARLFASETEIQPCEFTSRRQRGFDVVEAKISCLQGSTVVDCKLRPGPGPGPDLNWMNYQCTRSSRKCTITGGERGFTAAYEPLFAQHNAGVQADRAFSLPPPR